MHKRVSLVVAVTVGFVVGCGAAAVGPQLVPPARAGTAPQHWEYQCKEVGASANEVMPMLNEFGAQGWELTTSARNGIWTAYCFKRPM